MSWSFAVTTPPTFECLSVNEVKARLHFDGTDEDAVIAMCLAAAREQFEGDVGRSLVTQTLTLTSDRFSYSSTSPMFLFRPPIQSITHVKFYDADGVQQTWGASNYQFDLVRYPSRLMPAYNVTWPTTRAQMNAVEIRYVAGNASPPLVPERQKQAICLLVGHMLENREALAPIDLKVVPFAYEHLTAALRNWDFG